VESGAKYREQRKKEGESEKTVRMREEDFFSWPPLFPSSHPLFFCSFFFGPSPLPKRWNRLYTPRLAPEDSPVAARKPREIKT